MQYILTEDEYLNLKKEGMQRIEQQKAIIFELCTKVADHMPVRVDWRNEIIPWKCIHSVADGEWYCDECPVQKQCPYESKHWSK